MKIELNENEILEAVKVYLLSQGLNLKEKETTISFIAGRGDSGGRAEITINPLNIENLVNSIEPKKDKPETKDILDDTPVFG